MKLIKVPIYLEFDYTQQIGTIEILEDLIKPPNAVALAAGYTENKTTGEIEILHFGLIKVENLKMPTNAI